jgi:hypothetical protein
MKHMCCSSATIANSCAPGSDALTLPSRLECGRVSAIPTRARACEESKIAIVGLPKVEATKYAGNVSDHKQR